MPFPSLLMRVAGAGRVLRRLPRANRQGGTAVAVPVRSMSMSGPTVPPTETEKEEEAARKKSDMIVWHSQDTSLQARKVYTYSPSRIEQEIKNTGPDFKMGEFTMTNYFAYVRQPWLSYLTNYPFWLYKQQVLTYKELVTSQRFVKERLLTLGPDLAAAHFLCHRNCRVRFRGHDHWTEADEHGRPPKLLAVYEPDWYIEAIDAAESSLVYEGLHNLRNLVYLKYLDISYCPEVDAWFVDRLTAEYRDSLEYLDLSGCPSLTAGGIECLWRFKNLKTLVLHELVDRIPDLKLICLLLLEVHPDLDIRGVDYIDPKLLKGTPHEHLLEYLDDELLTTTSGQLAPGDDSVTGDNSHKGKA